MYRLMLVDKSMKPFELYNLGKLHYFKVWLPVLLWLAKPKQSMCNCAHCRICVRQLGMTSTPFARKRSFSVQRQKKPFWLFASPSRRHTKGVALLLCKVQ